MTHIKVRGLILEAGDTIINYEGETLEVEEISNFYEYAKVKFVSEKNKTPFVFNKYGKIMNCMNTKLNIKQIIKHDDNRKLLLIRFRRALNIQMWLYISFFILVLAIAYFTANTEINACGFINQCLGDK